MPFKLSNRSLRTLEGVDPRLVAVVKRAIEISEVDFMVVQGRRTLDEQARLFGQGRTASQMAARGLPMVYAAPQLRKVTWTMRSNHLPDPETGLGRAVDLAAWVKGRIDWNHAELYKKISVAMKKAAEELNVGLRWGGDFVTTKDLPHYELKEVIRA